MGQIPSHPSCRNLPRPGDPELLAQLEAAGFQYGEALDNGLTHHIDHWPDGWFMCDRSNRGDLACMTLYNPEGVPIADIDGKFTSYDSYCLMSPSNGGDRMDMTTVRIDNETKMAVI